MAPLHCCVLLWFFVIIKSLPIEDELKADLSSKELKSVSMRFARLLTAEGDFPERSRDEDVAVDDGFLSKETLAKEVSLSTGRNSIIFEGYKCHLCLPPTCEKFSICYGASQCWKARVRETSGEEHISRGCTKKKEQVALMCKTPAHSAPQEEQHPIETVAQYAVQCCIGDLCNNGSFPELPALSFKGNLTPYQDDMHVLKLSLSIICPIVGLIIILVLGLTFMRNAHRKRMSEMSVCEQDPLYRDDLHAIAAGDSTLREIFEHSLTSGSGAGLPLLIQRTLAKQISLLGCIGKGRYGEVWRGVWHGEAVAVKIFFSRDEASWTRETEIYSTTLLRHDNILGYIGSDMTSRNSCTQLWLVTHYHQLGSLYDYLNHTSMDHLRLVNLALSAANGLVFLHTEIFGTQSRPAIAHRDIKSKNILVKVNGTCVIADFGLAVTHTQATGELNIGQNSRVGTKRYMAPEVLDETINAEVFESFRRVDMYAFGLVLWELCRRTLSGGIVEDYKPPFFEFVPSDPSFEDMRKVVCVDHQRPSLSNRWASNHLLAGMSKLMRECWHQNPNVRLPALRVKKTILKLAMADPLIGANIDS